MSRIQNSKIMTLKSESVSAQERSTEFKSTASERSDNDNSFSVFKSCKNKSEAKETSDSNKIDDDLWSDEGIPTLKGHEKNDENANDSYVNDTYKENKSANNVVASKRKDISDLLKDNALLRCPLCLRPNNFEQSSGFVAHLKSCAHKNRVSTDQLIKAIELHEKQTVERIALGLPVVEKEKAMAKKKTRKVAEDSNLQLAIALSTSLRESEITDKLKRSEALLEAGLSREAMSQYKQLENYGFVTSKPIESTSKNANSKTHRNTVLFSRGREERERIVTEKIAMILIGSDSNSQPSTVVSDFVYEAFCVLKSAFLTSIRDESCFLWRKSYQMDELTNEESYYVENLSGFVSPCKIKMGAKLKHLSQIPCRPASPERVGPIREFKTFVEQRDEKKGNVVKCTPTKFHRVNSLSTNTDFQLANDWRSLVNHKFMSDVTIFAKNEKLIYAHKLVLYARFPSILSETVKEEENGRCEEMLMWLEYYYESVIAFLEYIYTGRTPDTNKLDEGRVKHLKNICARYGFVELKKSIELLTAEDTIFESDSLFICDRKADDHRPSPNGDSVDVVPSLAHEETFARTNERAENVEDVLSSPEMFCREVESSSTSSSSSVKKVDEELEIEDDAENVFDALNNKRFALGGVTPDKSRSLRDSMEKRFLVGMKNECTPGGTIIEEIVSDLCRAEKYEVVAFPENSGRAVTANNFENLERYGLSQTVLDDCVRCGDIMEDDVICLSSDNDDEGDIGTYQEVVAIQLSSRIRSAATGQRFKRKSRSPLLQSPPKKKPSGLREKEFPTETEPSESVAFAKRKKPLSRTLSLSPSGSDDSFDRFTTKLTDADREAERDAENSRESPSKDGAERKNSTVFEANTYSETNDKPASPYVSPVWDGFENANDEYLRIEFSSEPYRPFGSTYAAKAAAVGPNFSFAEKITEEPSSTSSRFSQSGMPSFSSFIVDENSLDKIENERRVDREKTRPVNAAETTERKPKPKFPPKSRTSATPIYKSSGKVTPRPDYSNMPSPELKDSLDKYGIKTGLGKVKAKQLLDYIYDKLHPYVDETDSYETRARTDTAKKRDGKRRKKNSFAVGRPDKPIYEISSTSEDSGELKESDIVVLEETISNENVDDELYHANASGNTDRNNSVSIDSAFREILAQDTVYHAHILRYRPIWIEHLMERLKQKGAKCGVNSLKDYLDEKCLTFRVKQSRKICEKRRK